MFKVMEEYNWDNFAVITSLYPGYEAYVDYIRSFTDTSYFLWDLQDVLTFDMSEGMSDIRARRVLQQVDAQVLLVYCSHDEARFLFRMAADVGLVGPGYIWMLPAWRWGTRTCPRQLPRGPHQHHHRPLEAQPEEEGAGRGGHRGQGRAELPQVPGAPPG
ncbi:hypothetical protein ANANG_G00297360 [Anguilla anguilla]|uniref:Receptor ligand binding region domain-containing protein n=1 Tax=Anguilla anguilla TaxID=7936 RepID=A0A9D3LM03_ANGAN|nr:hypothetical protein ANANG_G00297360 [Anguilla anguilla]